MIRFAKAHAYGNDFLYVQQPAVAGAPLDRLAREMCDRHTGIGADGLIVYTPTPQGAAMRLFNADGSRAEVSGNGVRALGALLGRDVNRDPLHLTIDTEGGTKRLTRLGREGNQQTFRAAMGLPTNLHRAQIAAGGETIDGVVLNIGNPQLIVLGPLPDDERFQRIGSALEHHARFPEGTNIEFVHVETPSRLRIRIVCVARRSGRVRRGGAVCGRHRAGRVPARGVGGGQRLPDGVGRGPLRRGMAADAAALAGDVCRTQIRA